MAENEKNDLSNIIINNAIVKESLPLPYAHYPGVYGIFICFSETEYTQAFFCSCMKRILDHYILNIPYRPQKNNEDPLSNAPLPIGVFPEKISKLSLDTKLPIDEIIKYKDKICHCCNSKKPTIRAMHPMYGGTFKQYYNWYIEIEKLDPVYLNPTEKTKEIYLLRNELSELKLEANKIRSRLPADYPFIKQSIFKKIINNLILNIKYKNPKEKLSILDKSICQKEYLLNNCFENIVREKFGYKKIGQGWTSETMLFKTIQTIYKGKEVIFHHRPKWLNGLEIDVFVPEINTGFEYQGIQHFKPIENWGGKTALEKTKARDKLKKKLLEENNIKLVEIFYYEEITEELIKMKTSQIGIK